MEFGKWEGVDGKAITKSDVLMPQAINSIFPQCRNTQAVISDGVNVQTGFL